MVGGNNMLGTLSEKYESNGDPGAIGKNAGDAGGASYGKYQFSSAFGVVDDFIQFCKNLGNGFYEILTRNPVGSLEFDTDWLYLSENFTQEFSDAQYNYTKSVYYDSARQKLIDELGIDIETHSQVLCDVVWSAAVQFSSNWITELFREAAEYAGKEIDEMTDADWIYWTYEVRLIDMSWSSGSPSLRPGLFNRWTNEREEALAMLDKG